MTAAMTKRKPPPPPELLLTQSVHDRIVRYIRQGVSVVTACERAGIHRQRYYDWLARAQTGEEPYASFARDVGEAWADLKATVEERVHRASKKDWRAGAWWLERKFPSEYAGGDPAERPQTRDPLELPEGAMKNLGPVDLSKAKPDELEALDRIRRRMAGEDVEETSGAGVVDAELVDDEEGEER